MTNAERIQTMPDEERRELRDLIRQEWEEMDETDYKW